MPLDLIASRLQAFRSQSKAGQQQLQEYCKQSPFERTKKEVQAQLAKAEKYRATILKSVTTFAGLNPEAIIAAAQSMEEVFYKRGDIVIRQDDIGDSFYVLEEGVVSVTRKSNAKDPDEVPRELTRLGRNAHFGEISLLTAEPRSATVTVLSEEAKCLRMTKHEFEELLATTNKLQAESRRQIGRDVLDTVPMFKTLTTVNKKKLLESMIPMTYLPGSYICRQGTTGNTFFILTEGNCKVTINTSDRTEREVASLRVGDFFGEIALIESSNRRTANVISVNTVSCLTLSRADFNRLLRNLKVKLMEHQAMRSSAAAKSQESSEAKHLSSLSRKRRISGYNTHGQRDEVRIANLLRRFAKFTTEALWNSMYSRLFRDLLLDSAKVAEYGKFAAGVARVGSRFEAVEAIAEQTFRILDVDPARRTSAENAFILGLMKQRSMLRDKLCKGWPHHHFTALCRRLKVQRIKPFRKIVEADTRGTTAFLILRGAVRIYGSVKRGEGAAKAYFEEDLFPGEIFGEAALSGMHTRMVTAISVTSVDVVVIDDQDYMAAQDRDTQLMGTEERSRFLNEIPLFKHWDSYKLIRLAHALVQEDLPKNTSLTTHLTVAPSLIFIVQGRVDLVDSIEKHNIVTTLLPHDYCGESGLLNRFVKAVNKKVTEEFHAVAASRLDVLVLPETAFHLFDPVSVDQLRSAFEAKLVWRRERVHTMKWERARMRRQYRLMHLEASLMDLDHPNGMDDEAAAHRRAVAAVPTFEHHSHSPMGLAASGRSMSDLLEEISAAGTEGGEEAERAGEGPDLAGQLQALRPASPLVPRANRANDFPLPKAAPPQVEEPQISAVDAAYRAALVHPLDQRLQSSDVWLPAARTGPKVKMDRLEDIPAVLSQDLDMLMVASSCKDARRLCRIQECVLQAKRPGGSAGAPRERAISPSPPALEIPEPSLPRELRTAEEAPQEPSLQFYVRAVGSAPASEAPRSPVRPSTAPARGAATVQPFTSPLLQVPKRPGPSSARTKVRVDMPTLPSPLHRQLSKRGVNAPLLLSTGQGLVQGQTLAPLSVQNQLSHAQSHSLIRAPSVGSFLLAPGSALEDAAPASSPYRLDDWGLTVQAVRPHSAAPAALPAATRARPEPQPQRLRSAQGARRPPSAKLPPAMRPAHSSLAHMSDDGSAPS